MLRPYWDQEIRFSEIDAAGYRVALGVSVRYRRSCRGDVGGVEIGGRQLLCQRDRDAAGAGAYVGDLQTFAGGFLGAAGAEFAESQAVQGDFDYVFGFGAGNQYVGSDFEFEAPEFLLAGEVLGGLACGSAGDQIEKMPPFGVGDDFFRMRVEPGAIAVEHVKKEQLGR